jgi:predicted DNA-binding transcriptional regulator AlpA
MRASSNGVHARPSAQLLEWFACRLGTWAQSALRPHWGKRAPNIYDLDYVINIIVRSNLRASVYGACVQLRLAGLAEVAEIVGVSRRTAARYANRSDFPTPVARLRAGPVWLIEDVEAWAGSIEQPARGRPLKAPRNRDAT